MEFIHHEKSLYSIFKAPQIQCRLPDWWANSLLIANEHSEIVHDTSAQRWSSQGLICSTSCLYLTLHDLMTWTNLVRIVSTITRALAYYHEASPKSSSKEMDDWANVTRKSTLSLQLCNSEGGSLRDGKMPGWYLAKVNTVTFTSNQYKSEPWQEFVSCSRARPCS